MFHFFSLIVVYPLRFIFACTVIFFVFKIIEFYLNLRKLSAVINRIPGLTGLPILGNMSPRYLRPGKLPYPIASEMYFGMMGTSKIFEKEGIFRSWKMSIIPFVVVYTSKNVEPLLSSSKEIEKSDDYKTLESWLGSAILTSKGSAWKHRRRLLTPSFHFSILDDFQSVFDKHSKIMVKKIKQLVDEDYVDALSLISFCTIDIIHETALGISISTQEDGSSPFMKALQNVTRIFTERPLKPWLLVDFIFNHSAVGKLYQESVRELHNLSQMVINQRKSKLLANKEHSKNNEEYNVKKNKAFLDLLLDEHLKNSDFTEYDIICEVNTFTFAGHDTTTTALSWCVFELGFQSDIQEKILREIEIVLGKDVDTPVQPEHLKSLKYLECVLKESLRIHPSAPFIARQLKDDLVIDKYLIPKGTNCVVNVAFLHLDSTVFPDAEKFIPERFELEQVKGRSPYAYIPFSAGPRNCIGQKFAMNEMKTIMVNLVRNFTWVSLDQRDKIIVVPEIVGRPYPGHRIKFFKRF